MPGMLAPTPANTPHPEAAVTRAERPGRRAWLVLIALLLLSVAAPLNQFKVPPILPVLMDAFALAVGRAGLLMSVYAITGLLLALPAGLIFQKLGYRWTAVLAGGSLVLGAALGATAMSLDRLLTSRVIEGIGTSLVAVMAPAIIALWFSARRRGTAMGIWSAWVPIGSLTMLVLGPRLAEAAGWRAVWWFGAAYAAVATLIFLIVVKPAPHANAGLAQSPKVGQSPVRVLRNRQVWLLALSFAFFNAAVIALATFMPTYLNLERGVPLRQAALTMGLVNLAGMFSAPVGGVISDRLGSRRAVYLAGFAAMTVILPLMGTVSLSLLPLWVFIQGVFGGMIPTNIFAAGVEAAGDERLGGMAMGVIQLGQNAGMLAGPLLFGALAGSAGGWPLAFASLGALSLLGGVTGWLAGGSWKRTPAAAIELASVDLEESR
jgi:MFS family permease